MDDFQGHTGIKWQGDVGVVQYGGGDSKQVVMFYLKPVRNPAKSAEMGRPYFDDKVFVRIHPPGERLNIVGLHGQRSIEACQRLLRPPYFVQDGTAIDERFNLIWTEGDGAVVALQCCIELLSIMQHGSATGQRFRIVRT